jgi:hypothetical protein
MNLTVGWPYSKDTAWEMIWKWIERMQNSSKAILTMFSQGRMTILCTA